VRRGFQDVPVPLVACRGDAGVGVHQPLEREQDDGELATGRPPSTALFVVLRRRKRRDDADTAGVVVHRAQLPHAVPPALGDRSARWGRHVVRDPVGDGTTTV